MTSMFHLLLGGDRPPRPLPVSGALTVGSSPSCDLVLSGDGVDAEHVRLECSATGVRLVDLASSDGTRVNGSFVSRKDLEPGDRISIGSHLLGFVPVAGATPPPAAAPAPRAPAPRSRARGGRPKPVAPPPRPAGLTSPLPPKSVPQAPRTPPVKVPVSPSVSSAGPARPPRERKAPVGLLLAVGGLLVAIVIAVVIGLGPSDEDPIEAQTAYDRATALLVRGEVDEAQAAFEAIGMKWPRSASARKAAVSVAGIQRDREQDRLAHEAMEDIWAERENLGRHVLLGRLHELQKEYGKSRVKRDLADYERRLDAYYEQVALDACAAARKEASEAMDEGGFMAALVVWREYYRLGDHIPKRPEDAKAEVERILAAAEKVAGKALSQAQAKIEKGRFDDALADLAAAEGRLRGTRFAASMRLAMETALAKRAASRGEEAPAAADTAERREALESLQEAELLASARRYEEAATAYRAHLEGTKDARLRRDIGGRLGELVDLAFLMSELRRQIEETPERFLGITLGGKIKGNVTSADEGGFVLSLTGGRSRLLWRRLDDKRMLELLKRMKFDGDGYAALSRFLFLADREAEAHVTLASASTNGAPAARIDGVLARVRRMDVPEGGFVLYRKRWYTPTERDEVALRDRIAALARKAGGSDRRRAEEAMQELREIGNAAKPALIAALSAVRETLRKQLFSMAAGNPGLIAMLVKDLKSARSHALSLIYDSKEYPYNRGSANPYGPNGAAVQKDVDERVQKVRDIWEDPLSHGAEKWPDLSEVLERLRAVDAEVASLSGEAPELPRYLRDAAERIGLAAAANGKSYQKSLETMALNAGMKDAVNVEERNCVLAVNAYRMMMGLGAVGINTALVAASRQHSTEMAELNYFAHNSPVPENRTPGMRARNAEFKGGGVSENIARGATTGKGAHVQWCHSSGHHRNVLGKGHTVIGVGQAQSSWWTQMFGRGATR